jgi:spore coat polysaccharide biosynthesis predicted glycosyltransferase SpsG
MIEIQLIYLYAAAVVLAVPVLWYYEHRQRRESYLQEQEYRRAIHKQLRDPEFQAQIQRIIRQSRERTRPPGAP